MSRQGSINSRNNEKSNSSYYQTNSLNISPRNGPGGQELTPGNNEANRKKSKFIKKKGVSN